MKKNKVKLTENGLKKLIKESTAKILKEMETENVPYEAWSEYLHGKEPLFEFEDGIIYVDYDENNGTLCSGHVTNVGFHKDGEVEVPVYDGNFQAALEEVYDQLSCNHEGLCENKGRKPKLTKSHLQKIINENIKRVLKEGKPFNTDEWQEQYRDNRGYKFSSKGSGANKQWKREKVSESQLHNIVKESINKVIQEVAGYQSTMQKANNQFNQNTMMGKLRSKIMPNKYQQYQRIQQQGNQMGQDAADRINNEREKMGYIDGLDRYMLNYGDYAESQGLGKHMETGKNWGDDREYMNKYFSHERDLMNKGREAYNKNTAIDNGRVNKYGTNGRILKSEAGWNSEDNYNNDEYHKQRNELGLPTHN